MQLKHTWMITHREKCVVKNLFQGVRLGIPQFPDHTVTPRLTSNISTILCIIILQKSMLDIWTLITQWCHHKVCKLANIQSSQEFKIRHNKHIHSNKVVYGYSSLQCNIATPLRELTCHTGSQCYLPPGRGDIPAFTPAKAGTQFSEPGGMQRIRWVDQFRSDLFKRHSLLTFIIYANSRNADWCSISWT